MFLNSQANKRWSLTLVLLGVLFILARLTVLWFSLELYDFEEAQMGTLGLEVANGLTLPLLEYLGPPEAHEGGLIINGLIAGLYYSLSGPNGFTLKLVWLTFSLGSFLLLLSVVKQAFGARAAVFSALLLIASVPFFTFMNLTDTTVDSGALFCSTLILFFTVQALRSSVLRPLDFIALGLVCGLGLFFSYHTVTMIITCLTVGVLFRIRRTARMLHYLIIAGLIGLLPWLYFNITHEFWGLTFFFKAGVIAHHESSFLIRFYNTIGPHLMRAATFEDVGPINGHLLAAVYYASVALSLPILWYRSFNKSNWNKPAALLLGAFPIIFVLIYSANTSLSSMEFRRDFRHILSLFPYLFVAVGVAVDQLLIKKATCTIVRRAIGLTLLIACLTCGTISTAGLLTGKGLVNNLPPYYPGKLWHWLAFKVGLAAEDNPQQAAGLFNSIKEKYQPYDYPDEISAIGDAGRIVALFQQLEPQSSHALIEGFGEGIGRWALRDFLYQRQLRRLLNRASILIGEVGRDPIFLFPTTTPPAQPAEYVASLEPRYQPLFCKGLGATVGLNATPEIQQAASDSCRKQIVSLNAFFEGLGLGHTLKKFNSEAAFDLTLAGLENRNADFIRGAGIAFGMMIEHCYTVIPELIESDTFNKSAFFKGLGIGLGWHFHNDPTLLYRFEMAWSGKLRPSDPFKAREFSYASLKLADLFGDSGAARESFLFGLGKGFAHHVIHNSFMTTKIVPGDPGSGFEKYCTGLSEGVGLIHPNTQPADEAMRINHLAALPYLAYKSTFESCMEFSTRSPKKKKNKKK